LIDADLDLARALGLKGRIRDADEDVVAYRCQAAVIQLIERRGLEARRSNQVKVAAVPIGVVDAETP
jgi:hypothetical protein